MFVMQDQTTEYREIRNAAGEIRVDPPEHAWSRVEDKLASHKAEKRVKRMRFISYSSAAAFLLLLTFTLLIETGKIAPGNNTYSVSMLEPVADAHGESIYTVVSVRKVKKSLSETFGK